MAERAPGLRFRAGACEPWVAWLSSHERGALPSSPLMADGSNGVKADRIAPWKVTALR